MEVAAPCIQILMNVFTLLSTLSGHGFDIQVPDIPIISPKRLQFFEYESVSIQCFEDKDMNPWRVMRKLYKISPTTVSEACSIPASSCIIGYIFERHSGEYWCENDKGQQSLAFNISVSAGSVILDVAAQPVNEGSNVVIKCINKNSEQKQITDFFKDGLYLKTNLENVLNLQNVSKSDEGLYKCSISGAGESAESWLTVVTQETGSYEETQKPTHVIAFVLRTMAFLSLVIGLIFFKKCNGENTASQPDQDKYASAANRMTGKDVGTVSIGTKSIEQQPY